MIILVSWMNCQIYHSHLCERRCDQSATIFDMLMILILHYYVKLFHRRIDRIERAPTVIHVLTYLSCISVDTVCVPESGSVYIRILFTISFSLFFFGRLSLVYYFASIFGLIVLILGRLWLHRRTATHCRFVGPVSKQFNQPYKIISIKVYNILNHTHKYTRTYYIDRWFLWCAREHEC